MKIRKILLLSLLSAIGMTHSALATSATWSATGGGTWITTTNWLGGVAAGSTSTSGNPDIATFNTSPGGAVTVDAQRGLNQLNFDTNVGSFTFNTSGHLDFASGGSINLLSTITSTGQTETIGTPIVINGSFGIGNNQTSTNDLLNITNQISSRKSSGTVTITLSASNSGINTISGNIIDGGLGSNISIGKQGSGTWVLSGSNSYTGSTGVSAGTLVVSGSLMGTSGATVGGVGSTLTLAGSGLINTSVTTQVNSGGTLAGNGTFGMLVANGSGTVAPGTSGSLGTLSATGNATFATNAAFNIKLGTAGVTQGSASNNDLLAVTGNLALPTGGNKITLNITDFGNLDGTSGSMGAGWYKIATFGGGLTTGDATSFSLVGPGAFTYSVAVNGNEIDLNVLAVPEPGTWAMLLGGFGLLGVWQRNRRQMTR